MKLTDRFSSLNVFENFQGQSAGPFLTCSSVVATKRHTRKAVAENIEWMCNILSPACEGEVEISAGVFAVVAKKFGT
jgi:hypothetical protein